MIAITRFTLTAALLASIASSGAAGAPKHSLSIGASAPDFSLPGVDGKIHALSDYAGSDVLMIVFTCNHCPTAQAYEGRMKKIVTDYRSESFALVAISPNDPKAIRLDELGYSIAGDTLEDMKIHAENYQFNFPYLYDGETQKTSHAYGVKATPHVYIFDRERRLRYVGRIDDDEKGTTIKSHDARNAIDALLAGKPVPVAETRVFGCSTKWAEKRASVRRANEAWNQRPVTLEPIDTDGIRKLVANKTEKLRLINLWATWCGPCVAEMPDLVAINRSYQSRGFELITISLDDPGKMDAALKLLTEKHVAVTDRTGPTLKKEGRTTNNYLYPSTDKDALAEALDPKWPGPIPYSILVAPGGKILARFEGAADPIDIKKAIIGHFGRTY